VARSVGRRKIHHIAFRLDANGGLHVQQDPQGAYHGRVAGDHWHDDSNELRQKDRVEEGRVLEDRVMQRAPHGSQHFSLLTALTRHHFRDCPPALDYFFSFPYLTAIGIIRDVRKSLLGDRPISKNEKRGG